VVILSAACAFDRPRFLRRAASRPIPVARHFRPVRRSPARERASPRRGGSETPCRNREPLFPPPRDAFRRPRPATARCGREVALSAPLGHPTSCYRRSATARAMSARHHPARQPRASSQGPVRRASTSARSPSSLIEIELFGAVRARTRRRLRRMTAKARRRKVSARLPASTRSSRALSSAREACCSCCIRRMSIPRHTRPFAADLVGSAANQRRLGSRGPPTRKFREDLFLPAERCCRSACPFRGGAARGPIADLRAYFCASPPGSATGCPGVTSSGTWRIARGGLSGPGTSVQAGASIEGSPCPRRWRPECWGAIDRTQRNVFPPANGPRGARADACGGFSRCRTPAGAPDLPGSRLRFPGAAPSSTLSRRPAGKHRRAVSRLRGAAALIGLYSTRPSLRAFCIEAA